MEKKTREQRLHEVAELIERSRTFAMDRYANHCGTPGCIAGHVVALERGAGRIRKYMLDDFSNQRIADMAQEILGLSDEQADDLFRPDTSIAHWMAGKKYAAYIDADRAAKQCRHFARTGRIDWSRT